MITAAQWNRSVVVEPPNAQGDGGTIPYPPGTDESVIVQGWMIKDMSKKGRGKFCMNEPDSGRPMTFGQVFEMHALLLHVIAEVEARG